jgi:thymidylate synthase (FAD)
MTARVVAVTQPVDPSLNAKDLIGYCARVSNPENQMNTETSNKLLSYLKRHQHWSPFEMAHAVLEVKTTRDIARQLLRHRSFSFQEFSQRYAEATEFEHRETRMQDTTNRQNSIRCSDPVMHIAFSNRQQDIIDLAKSGYDWALSKGIAKEQARALLPEGLTMSTLYVSGNIRSWMHYVELRSGVETQLEHRELAIECGKALEPYFPDLF